MMRKERFKASLSPATTSGLFKCTGVIAPNVDSAGDKCAVSGSLLLLFSADVIRGKVCSRLPSAAPSRWSREGGGTFPERSSLNQRHCELALAPFFQFFLRRMT